MRKNNKGFTLIELLAVIVILAIILVIATTNVIRNINNSREKSKYIAAKEIVQIASAYIETVSSDNGCVKVKDMINDGYLESDVTNPETGENGNISDSQKVCKKDGASEQSGYELQGNEYEFNGYVYYIK